MNGDTSSGQTHSLFHTRETYTRPRTSPCADQFRLKPDSIVADEQIESPPQQWLSHGGPHSSEPLE